MRTLREYFQQLLRRQHLAGGTSLTLDSRHIYIVPTRHGWLFGALLALMLLASLNYDNNPAYLLTFLLFSLAVNGMFFTWRNLLGLRLQLLALQPVFAGSAARLPFQLEGQHHASVILETAGRSLIQDIGGNTRRVSVAIPVEKRGWFRPGELALSSRYPLGLFRAWSVTTIDDDILVYPRPADTSDLPRELFALLSGGDRERPGEEELYGLRDYRSGDPLSHADWKGLARGRDLMTKQFNDPARDQPLLIDWDSLAPRDTEQRLSVMTRLVIEAERVNHLYGLRLPGIHIAPGNGNRHYLKCLKTLALYGLPRA